MTLLEAPDEVASAADVDEVSPSVLVPAIELASRWRCERLVRLLEKDFLTADQRADLKVMFDNDVDRLVELGGAGL